MHQDSIEKLSFFKDLSIYDFLEDNISQEHQVLFFSFHDHWLTYEETVSTLMSYNNMVEDSVALKEYEKFEQKIASLFNELYKNYNLYTIKIEDDNEQIYGFDSFSEIENIIRNGLQEKEQLNIIISELKTVILSNYDLTWPVYTLGKDNNKIKELFKTHNINIL